MSINKLLYGATLKLASGHKGCHLDLLFQYPPKPAYQDVALPGFKDGILSSDASILMSFEAQCDGLDQNEYSIDPMMLHH